MDRRPIPPAADHRGRMRDGFETDLVAALPRLRRFALSLCRRGDLADDLVQTTVEKALAARARFDPASRIDPWLFRILRNAWLDLGRRAATRGARVGLDEAPDLAAPIGAAREAEARLMLDKTEAALATLPEEQREVILLVCFEDLSYAEAAEVLGIPKGTVMSRLSRGRVALAGILGIN